LLPLNGQTDFDWAYVQVAHYQKGGHQQGGVYDGVPIDLTQLTQGDGKADYPHQWNQTERQQEAAE
jgi:hypothetical protein